MQLNSLEDLYLDQLQDLYSAEEQILESLPEIIEGAEDEDLREALQKHLDKTKEHKKRLERIFKSHGEAPNGETCKGMQGVLEEGAAILEEDGKPEVIDAGIIAGAQRVEHYEMAGYGTARTFARQLGYDEAADILQTTLDEEAEADEILSAIAENRVNRSAEA